MTIRIRKRFGFVCTGKFDLNTLRVDGNIFLNLGTKSYGFKNIRIRVDGALVGRENRLEIYWCVFCSIFN